MDAVIPGVLRSGRLDLIPYTPAFCRAVVAGDRGEMARYLGAEVGSWPTGSELEHAFPTMAERLAADPALAPWLGRAIVVRSLRRVAGSVNLKGPPEAAGWVEIGYGLEPPFRGHGYALEAVGTVVGAVSGHPAVSEVIAVIDPANTASVQLVEHLGFRPTGEGSTEHPGFRVWAIVAAGTLRD